VSKLFVTREKLYNRQLVLNQHCEGCMSPVCVTLGGSGMLRETMKCLL